MMKNALVILAGGKGKRFGQKIPKQFLKIGNTNFLNYFISNLDLSCNSNKLANKYDAA